jgi:Trypsin
MCTWTSWGGLSDDSDDAVVMIVHVDPTKNPCNPLEQHCTEVCTGTMIAPKLVITARHCVAKTDGNVACDSNGTPILGGQVLGNRNPPDFFVFTGKNRPDFIGDKGSVLDTTKWHPQGQGGQILDDHSATLCEHDLAMLLLKDPIPNVPLATLRLDLDPAVGEPLTTVGWGVASDEVEPKVRRRRSGDVSVERLGPDSTFPVLTKTEYRPFACHNFDDEQLLLPTALLAKRDDSMPIRPTIRDAMLAIAALGGHLGHWG